MFDVIYHTADDGDGSSDDAVEISFFGVYGRKKKQLLRPYGYTDERES